MHIATLTALAICLQAPISLAKSLWSSKPAVSDDVLRTSYPIGNGKVAVLPFGEEAGKESLSINRDSLWSGGPFENNSYNGGNAGQRSQFLPGIRDWIWHNGTGNVSKLMGDNNNYGAFAVLGNLTVTIEGVQEVKDYKRSLDLDTGVHTTTYAVNGSAYTIKSYCSYPDDVCVYDIGSTKALPRITLFMANTLTDATLVKSTCSSGQIQLRGTTQADIGMVYQATARAIGNSHTQCTNNSLVLHASTSKQATFVIAAGTQFDQTKGNAANRYSFRGADPESYVENAVAKASSKSSQSLLDAHVADYAPLVGAFTLDLPDTSGSSKLETADLVTRYDANGTTGDPYLESLTFDFARHLFISSSREGSLPPNLQGKWSSELSSAWGADYHANINIQMNHWHADQTGLGGLQTPLWEYMLQNWAPRGAETAKLLYDAPGWVVHNEMNIFGHTSMKTGDEIWADYPISAAWMMLHVWDHFDYSQDTAWLRTTGYPMLKAISEFWLSQLQKDEYFKDGTLVVNPCTSAEHGATTFGCTHYQQLIYQVFETTLQSAAAIGEQDRGFRNNIRRSLSQLDKGVHIGKWDQIQEWKIDMDVQNDTHRHLSNLVGWHPGFSVSSYQGGYTNETIRKAVETTLYSRGIGIIDSNAGWEKVWRSACWARLNNAERAHYELRLTIGENWAGNLLSMYSGANLPFQIDANFGFAGAVLSMLVVDLPRSSEQMGRWRNEARTVVLGPAIPAAWGNGSVKGLRLRGGGSVDFSWDGEGIVTEAKLKDGQQAVRIVNKDGKVLAQHEGRPGWHW